MNIFVVDYDPVVAGSVLCDQHTIKMSLETAQILCSAHWLNGSKAPYRLTHKNHPCTKWAARNYENYMWLAEHGLAICKEYTARYNRRHKCQDIIEWAKSNRPLNISSESKTPHPQCMFDDCKSDDVVEAYRTFYNKYKSRFATWKRNKPAWFIAQHTNQLA